MDDALLRLTARGVAAHLWWAEREYQAALVALQRGSRDARGRVARAADVLRRAELAARTFLSLTVAPRPES